MTDFTRLRWLKPMDSFYAYFFQRLQSNLKQFVILVRILNFNDPDIKIKSKFTVLRSRENVLNHAYIPFFRRSLRPDNYTFWRSPIERIKRHSCKQILFKKKCSPFFLISRPSNDSRPKCAGRDFIIWLNLIYKNHILMLYYSYILHIS